MDFIDLKQTAASIADWYADSKRDLPWRRGRDPYRIWISEIMLQQTRIEAVIPYYERFLKEVPDVASLASLPEDRLLKLWEGLGYYSRARNLKKAAEILMESRCGRMPETAQQLRQLPGIGEYTAGSIASIAFGEASPAVDGNVMRVMMRLSACGEDTGDVRNRREVTRRLQEVYPEGEAAALLTEGLMELGERICIPNGMPLCSLCPAAALCRAHGLGRETDFPVRREKKERKTEERTVLLLRFGDCCGLRRRPSKGLLANMWEFPNREGHLTEEEVTTLLRERGLEPLSVRSAGKAKHIFSHIEWHMTGYLVFCGRKSEDLTWVTAEQMEREISIPAAFRFYKKQLQYL